MTTHLCGQATCTNIVTDPTSPVCSQCMLSETAHKRNYKRRTVHHDDSCVSCDQPRSFLLQEGITFRDDKYSCNPCLEAESLRQKTSRHERREIRSLYPRLAYELLFFFFSPFPPRFLFDTVLSHAISSEIIEASLERPPKATKTSNSAVASNFAARFSPRLSPPAATSTVNFPNYITLLFIILSRRFDLVVDIFTFNLDS